MSHFLVNFMMQFCIDIRLYIALTISDIKLRGLDMILTLTSHLGICLLCLYYE